VLRQSLLRRLGADFRLGTAKRLTDQRDWNALAPELNKLLDGLKRPRRSGEFGDFVGHCHLLFVEPP
jgi:hypothetical protein